MDEQSLVRIVSTAFSKEEISVAKNLLFDSVKIKKRNIKRKNDKQDSKAQRELHDILGLFKGIDPEEIPTFVAKDLQKLLPVNFDHVDVTKLLKDLLVLQKDIRDIKESYVTQEDFQVLKSDVTNLKTTSIVNNFEPPNFVNMKRGTVKFNDDFSYDSGPIGMLHVSSGSGTLLQDTFQSAEHNISKRVAETADRQSTTADSTGMSHASGAGGGGAAARAAVKQPLPEQPERTSQVLDPQSERNSHGNSFLVAHPLEKEKSFSDVVGVGEWHVEEPDEKWIAVQRQRLKNKFIGNKGKANIEPSDTATYIFEKTRVVVEPVKINMKSQRNYDAYKIFVQRSKPIFMDASLWPDGISFRRFVNFNRKSSYEDKRELNNKSP
ncbi:hypothetical protein O0L34_g19069 [Tuta absoluta]|nr:hypothetical protein O0L34_g19069 [Tuta absoluta]